MKHSLSALVLALLPTLALAQTDPGLSLGEPVDSAETDVPSEPQIGDTYVRATHGDWDLRCTLVAEDRERCHIFQLLQDSDGNAVASFRLAPLPENVGEAIARAELTAPLQTALQAGVTIAIDGGSPSRYPFSFCSEIGCHSLMGFRESEVAGFRRGVSAEVTVVAFPDPENPVVLDVSLAGFTAAYTALTEAE